MIDRYGLGNTLAHDNHLTESLQTIRTRLSEFSKEEQGRLVNWGYALTDAAMRTYIDRGAAPAAKWPITAFPL